VTPDPSAGRPSRPLWPLLVLLVVPFVVPVPGRLERMIVLRSFGVLAHFFLPGVLVWLLWHRGPLAGRLPAALLAGFALVAACELVQGYVGRHPRWQDALVDLAGAAAAAAWLRRRGGGGRRWLLAALLLLLVLPWELRKVPGVWLGERLAARRFPLLADFETRRELALWGENEDQGQLGLARVDSLHGRSALLIGSAGDVWPGIVMHGFPRDWSGYRELVFAARRREGTARRLQVRLADFAARRDGCFRLFSVPLGDEWRTYRLVLRDGRPLGECHRPFRLDDMDALLFYIGRQDRRTVVAIDDIHLE